MQFLRNLKLENGTGIVEYGLIVALIAIVSLSSVAVLGHSTSETFTSASEGLTHSENADTESTTTTEASGSDTTTTIPEGSGGGSDDGSDSEDIEGGGGLGGSTTTTEPAPTTTTTTEPATTTTTTTKPTLPDFPIAVTGIEGDFLVTYGYVDKKVVVVDTEMGDEWSVKVKKETKTKIELEFKNKKTGKVVKTTGWISKGELKTQVK